MEFVNIKIYYDLLKYKVKIKLDANIVPVHFKSLIIKIWFENLNKTSMIPHILIYSKIVINNDDTKTVFIN